MKFLSNMIKILCDKKHHSKVNSFAVQLDFNNRKSVTSILKKVRLKKLNCDCLCYTLDTTVLKLKAS